MLWWTELSVTSLINTLQAGIHCVCVQTSVSHDHHETLMLRSSQCKAAFVSKVTLQDCGLLMLFFKVQQKQLQLTTVTVKQVI